MRVADAFNAACGHRMKQRLQRWELQLVQHEAGRGDVCSCARLLGRTRSKNVHFHLWRYERHLLGRKAATERRHAEVQPLSCRALTNGERK